MREFRGCPYRSPDEVTGPDSLSPLVTSSDLVIKAGVMAKTYTKTEAADYLEVSTRAVERYVAKGKLTPTYARGATGQIATFTEAELKKVKTEMEAPPVRPAHPPTPATSGDGPDKALARRGPSDLSALVAALREGTAAAISRQASGAVSLTEKMMLSVFEASELSGVSRGLIERAVREGKLKGAKVGHRGAWAVRRADLEAWVKKL